MNRRLFVVSVGGLLGGLFGIVRKSYAACKHVGKYPVLIQDIEGPNDGRIVSNYYEFGTAFDGTKNCCFFWSADYRFGSCYSGGQGTAGIIGKVLVDGKEIDPSLELHHVLTGERGYVVCLSGTETPLENPGRLYFHGRVEFIPKGFKTNIPKVNMPIV